MEGIATEPRRVDSESKGNEHQRGEMICPATEKISVAQQWNGNATDGFGNARIREEGQRQSGVVRGADMRREIRDLHLQIA